MKIQKISFSQLAVRTMASSSRFGCPKSREEEIKLLENSTPKNTVYNTKWAIKIFKEWQISRKNKDSQQENIGYGEIDLLLIGNLTVKLEEMSPETINFE